jgi:7-cyano-7-deazaguanine synthase in queuosine biosynthesis
LKGSDKEIAQNKDYATLMHEKIEKGEAPVSDEYIPNRNSLFLNTLAAIGLQKFENHPVAIFTGIHSDDVLKQEGSNVGAYPDCSLEFAVATNKALQLATAGLVYVYTPLVNKSKAQVAEFGVENGMSKQDFNETWSCYKGVEDTRTKQCGKCPTCIDRIHALVNGKVFSSVKDITDNYDLTEEEAAKYFN